MFLNYFLTCIILFTLSTILYSQLLYDKNIIPIPLCKFFNTLIINDFSFKHLGIQV